MLDKQHTLHKVVEMAVVESVDAAVHRKKLLTGLGSIDVDS